MLQKKDKRYLTILVILLFISIIIFLTVNKYNLEKYNNHQKLLLISIGETIKDNNIKDDLNYDTINIPIEPESLNIWNTVAKEIYQKYNNYDGFVVLHEKNTLVYTATALSFMLENLGKTIVVTNDELENSIKLAKMYVIPEVIICNNKSIIRGCRSKMLKNTYISLNYPNIGEIKGNKIKINKENILTYPKETTKILLMNSNRKIILVKIFPGINEENIISDNVKGVVLEVYGTGQVSLNKNFTKVIKSLIKSGIIVVSVSQSTNEIENDVLSKIGVISAKNMTTEATFVKLNFIISNVPKYDYDLVNKLMNISMRGEIN
jgi:L-asparaginase/Glu-tRNA(Gln) amidotransferase subunit D